MSEYKFKIHTGDQYLAGTDSNIFVILQGVKGISREYRLNGLIKGNAFERNQTDEFTLNTDEDSNDDLGPIYAIQLRSDMMYAGAGWLLDTIEITSPPPTTSTTPTVCKFKISQWIEDKSRRTFYDSSQVKQNDVSVKEHNVEGGAIYFVPKGAKMTMEDTLQTKIGYHLSETLIEDITTSTKLTVSGAVNEGVKAALEFALSTTNKKEMTKTLTEEVVSTCTQKVELPVDTAKDRKYSAVYIVKDEKHTIQIGNLRLTVPSTVSQKAAGFKEVQ